MTPEAVIIEQLFMISDKDSKDVPFHLNSAQRELDEMILSITDKNWPIKLWIPKARQRGISAYVLGRFTAKCLGARNIKARIVAHTSEATQKLLGRVKYYIKHMKGGCPNIQYNTRNEITFPKTDSSISIYTAGSPEAARSETITHLHCSEAAFWVDPKAMTAALFQCVPASGERIVESSGNGAETWYHRSCLRAEKFTRNAQLYFLPWHTCSEYQVPYDPKEHGDPLELDEAYEEIELLKVFPEITPGQLLWRREKIEDMDMDIALFKQEYPMFLAECFQMAETSFFHRVVKIDSKDWYEQDPYTWALKGHPQRNLHYTLGCDVAAGVKKDRSVVEVFCYETGEQVFEYVSDTIPPNDLALVVEEIGAYYNWPVCVVESNNHGIATLDNLRENNIYPRQRVYRDNSAVNNIVRSGFRTTRVTKPLYLGRLRRAFALGDIIIYSSHLYGECNTFTDALKAEEGCFDDRVMATCMAYIGMEKLPAIIEGEKTPIYEAPGDLYIRNPFAYDAIFPKKKFEAQPLESQVSLIDY